MIKSGPDVILATSWASIIVSYFSNASMFKLLAAIAELSVLLHQFLINIVLNSSVEIFIYKMMRLASLDPLPIDDYLDEFFGE